MVGNFVSGSCLLEYDAVQFVREAPSFEQTCCLHLHTSSKLQTEQHITSKLWCLPTKLDGAIS
jgi:hypothetical protein